MTVAQQWLLHHLVLKDGVPEWIRDNENDEDGKEEKTSIVNENDTMDRKKLNMKDLMIDEEYIRNEQRTQIELRKEYNYHKNVNFPIPQAMNAGTNEEAILAKFGEFAI